MPRLVLNPKRYFNFIRFRFNKYCLHNLEYFMNFAFLGSGEYPPIFFIGAPRTGSTLMIQVITDSFDVGYLTNNHCRWFGMPALYEKFYPKSSKVKKSSDYKSNKGVAKGNHAPAECGEWWYRFFTREPAYTPLKKIDIKKMVRFRCSVLSMM